MFILLHQENEAAAEIVINTAYIETMQVSLTTGTWIKIHNGIGFPVTESITDIYRLINKE